MYRTLDTSFWTDPKVRKLPADAKLLALYLVTNPHGHLSGLYYLPDEIVAFETGLDAARLNTLWDTLSGAGFSRNDKNLDLVWVIRMFHYQGRGEKNERAAANHLPTLHNSFLVKDFLDAYPGVKRFVKDRVSDRGSRVGTQEQEQEQEQKKEQKKEQEAAGADGTPVGLTELIQGWSDLGPDIVKKGNGALLPPSKASKDAWNRGQKDSELREVFGNIPAVLGAIKTAEFCHRESWFTLPWLFGKNKNGELNAVGLLNGRYEDLGGKHGKSNAVGPGQVHAGDHKQPGEF